jgi:hypothetical protein
VSQPRAIMTARLRDEFRRQFFAGTSRSCSFAFRAAERAPLEIMASLLTLPVELVQHIATLLPCSAALNLLRVNRQLHTACNDRLVFHSIASNNLDCAKFPQHAETVDGLEISQTEWTDSELVWRTHLAKTRFDCHMPPRNAYKLQRTRRMIGPYASPIISGPATSAIGYPI